ncbi:hypothetical protein Tco_1543869, partial [Tanacetum coccineum]
TTTPLTLSDTTITTPTTTINIASFFSSPSTTTFYAPSCHLHKPTCTTNEPPLISWFSGRRKTHLPPSMKETNVTSNLAKYGYRRGGKRLSVAGGGFSWVASGGGEDRKDDRKKIVLVMKDK